MKTMGHVGVIAVLLGSAAPACALERWTWQDTAWEVASASALVLDWGTTRDGAWRSRHPYHLRSDNNSSDHHVDHYDTHDESNPILGRRPSVRAVDAYFISAIAIHAGVSVVLPSRWRRAWQASTVTVEILMWGGNVQAGLRVRF